MSIIRPNKLQLEKEKFADTRIHAEIIARALNAVVRFLQPLRIIQEDERDIVTLNANVATTVITNPAIGPSSMVVLTPVTPSGAVSYAAGIWVGTEDNRATLNHDVSAVTSRRLRYVIL